MREPGDLLDVPGLRIPASAAARAIRAALRGAADDTWDPPPWLFPHQVDAARRIAGALACFSGALLADAVGLGKTYVALAIATRYPRVTFVIPAALRAQWTASAHTCGVPGRVVTHEALSRGGSVPVADLLIVDEAHRFRNPATRRYDRLARGVRTARVLLLTATPVVNRADDLVHLLRLFLADHALAPFGLPALTMAEAGSPSALLGAVFPLLVARTARTARLTHHIPVARTAQVSCLPPLAPKALAEVVDTVGGLRFPPLGPDGRALLHRHLLLRLASSPEALLESLRRHRRYIELARAAARDGALPPRGAIHRLLLDGQDDQLALLLDAPTDRVPYGEELDAESRRITGVIGLLRTNPGDPKRCALITELQARRDRRTIVFTAARATALGIARGLGWCHVGVISATSARISSGRIPAAELLARFAPEAQGGGRVPAAMRVDVLVATDLASEGLNLQDADAVVHYDLPWNPFRLAQRLGRIARLGSRHRRVFVSWYCPPDIIDHPLQLLATIHRKAELQRALPVPVTGTVGRAAITSAALERRETLALDGPSASRGYAVVEGDTACCVLRWESGPFALRTVTRLDDRPFDDTVVNALGSREVEAPLPAWATRQARRLLVMHRRRCVATPVSPACRSLARRLLRLARTAAGRRDQRLLGLLDATLARLREGVAVGAERELAEILADPSEEKLRHWVDSHPSRQPRLRGPELEVLFVGESGLSLVVDEPAGAS
ncbi:MAG: DEAD/DEAH box helicase [Gemmatimonadota bacterium]|nr:DEAD/DEAH box helicase [Gemmatimonadota bacterium]